MGNYTTATSVQQPAHHDAGSQDKSATANGDVSTVGLCGKKERCMTNPRTQIAQMSRSSPFPCNTAATACDANCCIKTSVSFINFLFSTL